jgi:hypothetical protein
MGPTKTPTTCLRAPSGRWTGPLRSHGTLPKLHNTTVRNPNLSFALPRAAKPNTQAVFVAIHSQYSLATVAYVELFAFDRSRLPSRCLFGGQAGRQVDTVLAQALQQCHVHSQTRQLDRQKRHSIARVSVPKATKYCRATATFSRPESNATRTIQ